MDLTPCHFEGYIATDSLCRYLQKDKVNGPEGNTVVYELAERALDGEVSQKIKEYISQVLSISSFDLLIKHLLLYHF